jgi:hypothetical protein
MLYISPNSLGKNRINNAKKDYTISIACRDTRQPRINRKKDSRRNVILVL